MKSIWELISLHEASTAGRSCNKIMEVPNRRVSLGIRHQALWLSKIHFCLLFLVQNRFRVAFYILCALLSGVAFATTYPKLSLETQLERAEVIVRATIKEVVRVERNKRPWTVYMLQTQQFWRGEGLLPKTSDQPSFAIFGNDKIKLEGAPSFRVGEEWIFLLYTKNYDSPIVGFNQGAYRIEGASLFDVNNKPILLEGKPTTRAGFIAALEKILGVVR
jgi:hypothetical protein